MIGTNNIRNRGPDNVRGCDIRGRRIASNDITRYDIRKARIDELDVRRLDKRGVPNINPDPWVRKGPGGIG